MYVTNRIVMYVTSISGRSYGSVHTKAINTYVKTFPSLTRVILYRNKYQIIKNEEIIKNNDSSHYSDVKSRYIEKVLKHLKVCIVYALN